MGKLASADGNNKCLTPLKFMRLNNKFCDKQNLDMTSFVQQEELCWVYHSYYFVPMLLLFFLCIYVPSSVHDRKAAQIVRIAPVIHRKVLLGLFLYFLSTMWSSQLVGSVSWSKHCQSSSPPLHCQRLDKLY